MNRLFQLLMILSLSLSASMADHGEPYTAGHSIHGEGFNEGPRQQAWLFGGTGDVHLSITTIDVEAQQFFDQGLGQLHGFWFFEAERSFRQAAMLDPDSAMSYWGMSMANIDNEERAKKFIKQAVERKEKCTDLEKKLIAALEKQYADLKKEKKKRKKQYVRDMEDIVLEFPNEIEIKALFVSHLWRNDAYHGIKIASHAGVDALAREVLEAKPLHPIHHPLIHLWDGRKPEQALASAARCGQCAPTIAHMWHMPGHIYSKVHRYEDAAYHQEASARIDHRHLMKARLLPDQIHNYAHNNDWLAGTYRHMGRFNEARKIAKNMIEIPRRPRFESSTPSEKELSIEPSWKSKGSSYAYGQKRLKNLLIEGELWGDLIELSTSMYLAPAHSIPMSYPEWDHFMGVARYETGDIDAGNLHLKRLRMRQTMKTNVKKKLGESVKTLRETQKKKEEDKEKKELITKDLKRDEAALKKINMMVNMLGKAIKELEIYEALSNAEYEKATKLVKENKNISHSRKARLLVWAQNIDEASKQAEEGIKSTKKQVIPLATAIEIAYIKSDLGRVANLLPELKRTAKDADTDLPILQRINKIAALVEAGPALDPEKAPDDLLPRPDLETLGPRHWSPYKAPDWTLSGLDGKPISLADYHGKPVILIFYLGAECIHCIQQLNAFGPMIDIYKKEGIEVIAISSDPVEELSATLSQAEKSKFTFALASDAAHEVFKEYRAYDDFENQPLHGTFIIDSEGIVRWHDISFEPFDKPNFLLEETKRLLAFPKPKAAGISSL